MCAVTEGSITGVACGPGSGCDGGFCGSGCEYI